ncbi:hypothetical protein BFP97_13625 [Roseivirga sp. 4D4]|uniref:ATP-grasp domain-containing protein n=1 Tax=Roseivirga sp. 4D4 TaxID=1889784 RepID=UPI0008533776|nr:hypothetical protein [Roseivirga sp. 4D4]OEK02497.1 hypothetical protein BFP97_13625 [Roseivirga sp. 4D4]
MKLAIHKRPGSFSDRWIEYCKLHSIDYKLVNCYADDIIEQVKDCDGLMWHWHHADPKAILFARQLTLSLEKSGKKVFPNSDTSWHFDDKVGQKYLLEAMEAPIVKSHVFYSKKDAVSWVSNTSFPIVFKLRGGAGSINVRLVKSKAQADRLIRRSFSRGFPAIDRYSMFKDRLYHLKRDRDLAALFGVCKGFARLFVKTSIEKESHREKGYVYFQEFLPKNDFDTRVIIIGERAFAVRRYVRTGDFRASGSGVKGYERELFDLELIRESFDLSKKLNTQSLALDFIYDTEGEMYIVEISYGFVTGPFYDDCPGHWNSDLEWIPGNFKAQYFMMEDFITSIKQASH